MARFDIKIKGVDAIMRKIEAAPQKFAKESSQIIYETAREVESMARARVVQDTGGLMQSIRANRLGNGGAIVKAGLPNVSNGKGHLINYAAYVEWGTGKEPRRYPNLNNNELISYAATFKGRGARQTNLPARPFMYNSASETLGKMINKIKKIKI
jgi:HK97 gp10 family phage protein